MYSLSLRSLPWPRFLWLAHSAANAPYCRFFGLHATPKSWSLSRPWNKELFRACRCSAIHAAFRKPHIPSLPTKNTTSDAKVPSVWEERAAARLTYVQLIPLHLGHIPHPLPQHYGWVASCGQCLHTYHRHFVGRFPPLTSSRGL